MVEAPSRISESITENLQLTWQMYKEAINNIPEEEWRTGEIDYLIPARLILHGLKTLDYYSTPTPELSISDYQMKLNEQKISANQLPNQAQMNSYMKDIKEKLETWIKSLDDESFHGPETRFPWTGSTLLGRILYSLEHSRHHIGELNGELRRRGLPRVKWSYFKR